MPSTDRARRASLRELVRAVGRRVHAGRVDKHEAELAYWRQRHAVEGHLRNAHYEAFYTEHFGLQRSDYEGARVLDVGCGPRGSLEWATCARERVGLDPLVDEYRRLGIDAHEMTYVNSGAERIPFPDAYFDVVAAFNALDHVDDVDAAIGEMTRVTRSGGICLVIVEANHAPTATEPQSLEWNVLDRFVGWNVISRRRVAIDDAHDVYGSWARSEPWVSGPGLVGGRLERR